MHIKFKFIKFRVKYVVVTLLWLVVVGCAGWLSSLAISDYNFILTMGVIVCPVIRSYSYFGSVRGWLSGLPLEDKTEGWADQNLIWL